MAGGNSALRRVVVVPANGVLQIPKRPRSIELIWDRSKMRNMCYLSALDLQAFIGSFLSFLGKMCLVSMWSYAINIKIS